MVFWNEPNDYYPRLYARECLDLIDVYRQKHDGQWNKASEILLIKLETHAKDILDDLERTKLEQEGEEQKQEGDISIGGTLEDLHITSPVKTDPPTVKPATESSEDEEEVIRGNTWTSEGQKECDEEREKNPPFQIEGYLRRSGKYKPMMEYIPLSRDEE